MTRGQPTFAFGAATAIHATQRVEEIERRKIPANAGLSRTDIESLPLSRWRCSHYIQQPIAWRCLKYFVGYAGWRYGNWVSGFYRSAPDPRECLAYYSRVFELVVISVHEASAHALGGWARERHQTILGSLQGCQSRRQTGISSGNSSKGLQQSEKRCLQLC